MEKMWTSVHSLKKYILLTHLNYVWGRQFQCVQLILCKRPLSKRPKIGFKTNYRLTCRLKVLQNAPALSTFIKLPFVIQIFVLSIFERPFYTGFTVSATWCYLNNKKYSIFALIKISSPLSLPLYNMSGCQSLLKYLSLYCNFCKFSWELYSMNRWFANLLLAGGFIFLMTEVYASGSRQCC